MEKIVELKLNEITAVTGGVKTATASLSTTATQSTLSVSTVSVAGVTMPAFAVSTQSTASPYRF
jgi:hypothetical protein